MNRFRTNLVVLFAVFTLTLAGCTRKTPEAAPPSVVTDLAIAQTSLVQTPSTVDAVGTVHAKESAVLSAQIMGRVTSVTVREGDSVRAGQALLALDDASVRADVEHARAAVASSQQQVEVAQSDASLANSTLKRYQLLRDRKTISPQEFDEVERRSQAAEARLESARAQMMAVKASESGAGAVAGYTRLSAPFTGVVTARYVDPGAMATPGMPLLEVEKAGALQLNATVDESLIRSLQKGMSLPVEITALSSPMLTGRIAEIVPAADPTSHSFLIKIDLPAAAGLRSGMFGTASIGRGSHPALTVPQPAIIAHGSLNGVWVVDANRIASMRYVTLGAAHDGNVEVLSGLSAGETVVLSVGDRELGGNKIEVRQ